MPAGLTAARTLEAFHERTPLRVADTAVAEVDGAVVGFIMTNDDEVEQVFVDPAHHGSGVASLLLDEAERRVAAAGHEVAWLAVVTGNARARAFYEKRGWADGGDAGLRGHGRRHDYVSPCRRYVKRSVLLEPAGQVRGTPGQVMFWSRPDSTH